MMSSLGHKVFLYAGEENDAKVSELITVVTKEDLKRWFGDTNWETTVFSDWGSASPCWQEMNRKVISGIAERQKPGDIICNIAGLCQADVSKAFPNLRAAEWGIGYEGIVKDGFHVFESYAWMHHVYGIYGIREGRFFDTVIPNSYEDDEFIYREKKQDYFLFMARATRLKGLPVIEELAKRGHRIIAAGQVDPQIKGVEYVGILRGEKKAEYLANAKALLSPTMYIEPFGGVTVEAMLSGTPVITTDFGAYTETVQHNVTGFRCSVLAEFLEAAKTIEYLSPSIIRAYAERFLTSNVKYQYQAYFNRLALLGREGWYA